MVNPIARRTYLCKQNSNPLLIIQENMTPKNDITKRTAYIREWLTMPLVEKYDNLFKDSGTDSVAIATDNQ